MRLHPAKLKGIRVLELFAKRDPAQAFEPGGEFAMNVSHSPFDLETREIRVRIGVAIGDMDDEAAEPPPLQLRVSLAGAFEVDTERLPVELVEQWAKQNAPFVLFPYLREHVYSLSQRVVEKPILLPLIELPTLEVGSSTDAGKPDQQDNS